MEINRGSNSMSPENSGIILIYSGLRTGVAIVVVGIVVGVVRERLPSICSSSSTSLLGAVDSPRFSSGKRSGMDSLEELELPEESVLKKNILQNELFVHLVYYKIKITGKKV